MQFLVTDTMLLTEFRPDVKELPFLTTEKFLIRIKLKFSVKHTLGLADNMALVKAKFTLSFFLMCVINLPIIETPS